MLAYRNPSNEDSDNIFRYTLKLNAYVFIMSMWAYFSALKSKDTQIHTNGHKVPV